MSAHPILVTGSHRSGTTWVAKMLAASRQLAYVNEVFNPKHAPGVCSVSFPYWFQYITEKSEMRFLPALTRTMNLEYSPKEQVIAIRHPRDVREAITGPVRFWLYRRDHLRPLLKDPIAVFSAEWLANAFKMDVLIMIRHPAAFVSSLVKLGWRHPFEHFLLQPDLLHGPLDSYKDEIRYFARREQPILLQGILLWNLIHHMIAQYVQRHAGHWLFLRHEEVSRDPEHAFADVYARLGLSLTVEAVGTIRRHTSTSNPVDPKGPEGLYRDSLANISNWKHRLSHQDIEKIRAGTANLAPLFYQDKDW